MIACHKNICISGHCRSSCIKSRADVYKGLTEKYRRLSENDWQIHLTTSGHVSNQQALQNAHAEYDKYRKQQDLRLSPVEQSFLDSVEQLERIEEQTH